MAVERRVEKINNLLQEELARILERESEMRNDSLVTVTRVETSPDLQYASVYVSVFPHPDKASSQKQVVRTTPTLEILRKNVYHIQQMLNRRLRMRPIPKISFIPDEGEMRREIVEETLADLKQRGEI